jgi:hypothetical protein
MDVADRDGLHLHVSCSALDTAGDEFFTAPRVTAGAAVADAHPASAFGLQACGGLRGNGLPSSVTGRASACSS